MYTFGLLGSIIGLMFFILIYYRALVSQSEAKIGFFTEYSYLCNDVHIIIMMRIKLHTIVIALLSAVLLFSGCSNLTKVRLTSAKLEAFSPKGFKSAAIFFNVGVDNPAKDIILSDFQGEILRSGKVIGIVVADPIVLKGKSHEIYNVRAEISLAEGASMKDLLAVVSGKGLEDFTVDFYVKVKPKGGAAKKIRQKDIPLKKLIELI